MYQNNVVFSYVSVKVKKIVCNLPRPPSHGRIRTEPRGKREFNDGEFIYYECNQGYRLVGESSVRCFGRKWTSVPSCQRKFSYAYISWSWKKSL